MENKNFRLYNEFVQTYFESRKKPMYQLLSREFLYECLTKNIYNTELVLAIDGAKPVSRFIADTQEQVDFLQNWAKENSLAFTYRALNTLEERINLNSHINFILYLGKSEALIHQVKRADSGETLEDGIQIGDILGYPDCCTKAWGVNGSITLRQDTLQFFHEEYTDSFPLLNNPFFNFTQMSLTFFFPCHLGCENALKRHELFAQIIEKDNPKFFGEMKTLFSLPILLVLPKKPQTLTSPLHYDEIFRVHFIGKKIENTVIYKDFFISSFSFLDQPNDPEYAASCVEILYALLQGNRIVEDNGNILIQNGEKMIHIIDRPDGKIIQFGA